MSRRGLAGGLISSALLLIAVALAIVGSSDSGSEPTGLEEPRIVKRGDLRELEEAAGHPIYWAGDMASYRVELRRDVEGNAFVRYLPLEVGAGGSARNSDYLTVGTYPVPDAVGAVRRAAADAGVPTRHLGNAVIFDNSQGSVYLSQAGSDLQVEVYDPEPGRAIHLVLSGQIRPASR